MQEMIEAVKQIYTDRSNLAKSLRNHNKYFCRLSVSYIVIIFVIYRNFMTGRITGILRGILNIVAFLVRPSLLLGPFEQLMFYSYRSSSWCSSLSSAWTCWSSLCLTRPSFSASHSSSATPLRTPSTPSFSSFSVLYFSVHPFSIRV